MRNLFARFCRLLLLTFALYVVEAWAGTIRGTVSAQPKEGTEVEAGGGAYASRKFKFTERINYAQLRDFVVYIDQPVNLASAPEPRPVRIAQRDAAFSSHVLPVLVGTTVEWPNEDDIFHNVFSDSEALRFDLGLYKKGEHKSVTFVKPGRVDVFCSIHSNMHCIILVLENPFFASADSQGNFSIPKVPAGTYRLKAWHERVPSQVKEVVVPENGEIKVEFVLGVRNLPKI